MKTQFRFLCLCLAMLCVGVVSRAQLTGSISVPSTLYPDLKAAIDSLNNQGVGAGGVTINVTAGNPQTAPSGGYRIGSTVLNGSTSSSKNVIINGNNNTITAQVGTGSADAMLFIRGTDYVTWNGFNMTDPSTNTSTTTQMEWGVVLCKLNSAAPFDGCQNDVVSNNTITLNGGSGNVFGIYATHSIVASTATLTTTGATVTDANSNNAFTGNTISGVFRGVYLNGINNTSFYDLNNKIGGSTAALGNTITIGSSTTTSTAYSVYTQYDSSITVSNNKCYVNTAFSGGFYHVYPSTGKGDLIVTNNYLDINCNTSATVYVIYDGYLVHTDVSGTPTTYSSLHDISGNTITGSNSSASASGLYCIYDYYNACKRLRVSNNNIKNIIWNQGSTYNSIYGIYTYYNGSPYINLDSNTIYNIQNSQIAYYYGFYNYHYNSNFGQFSCQGNTQRKIQCNYYMYAYYVNGSGTTPPTGYTGQVFKFKNNVLDSVDQTGGSGTTYCYGNYVWYGFDTSEIKYNTFSNFKGINTGNSYVYNYMGYGYYGGTLYKSGSNKFFNFTCTGNLSLYNYIGYYATQTDSNMVYNITPTGTAGTINNYIGYYGTTNQVIGNKVYNITTGGAPNINYFGYYGTGPTIKNNSVVNINLGGSGAQTNGFGFYPTGSTVIGNRVDSITTTNGAINPFQTYANGAPMVIYGNNVSNLTLTTSTTAAVNGYLLQLTGTTQPVTFYNNFFSKISVPSGYSTTTNYALSLPHAASYNIYHNTLYVKNPTTSSGTGYGWSGITYNNTALLDLRNNIINVDVAVNGGYVAALRRTTSGTAGVAPVNFLGTSNGNIYYAPNTTNSWLYGEGTAVGSFTNTYNLTNDPGFNAGPCGVFKTFAGHDQASFTENNLSPATPLNTWVPTGATYAESGAVPTQNPVITSDYAGVSRAAVADIGALEFNGTSIDNAPPIISYTPLAPATYCVAPLSITATITDNSGVRIAPANAPRLYYKKSTETNAFGGGNTSATSGWKYVTYSSKSGNNYTFTFDYNLLTSGSLSIGDSITYFIIAMDSTSSNNTGATVAGFPICPTSVNLGSTNGPLNSAPVPYGFKVLITPAFNVTASPRAVCGSGSAVVTLSPNALSAGIQWQSATLTGSFSNITGATGQSISTGLQTTSVRYQAIISCGSTTLATTNIDTFLVANPAITSVTGATRCGYGSLTLTATPGTATTPRWYTSATGGTAVANGNSFATPNLTTTTTYYVSGVTPNAGSEVATKTPAYYSFLASCYGIQFTLRNTSTHFYSTTVFSQNAGTARFMLFNSSNVAMTNSNGLCYVDCPVVASSGVTTPSVCNLNYYNLPAGQYTLVQVPGPTGSYLGLNYEYIYPTAGFPFNSPSGNVSIDIGGYGNPSSSPVNCSTTLSYFYGYAYYYPFFYYNTFSAECEPGTRTPVTATVTPAPAINLTATKYVGVCTGVCDTFTVTSPNSSYVYSWTSVPGGFTATGSPVVVCPTTSPTTYRVTATDPYTGCVNTDTVKLYVNPRPAAPSITPVNPTICQKGYVNLTASAPPGLSGLAPVGTGTLTNTTTTYPTPYGAWYTSNHEQYLYRASELIAAGITPGNLTSLGFNQASGYTGGAMQNFQIKLITVASSYNTLSATMLDPSTNANVTSQTTFSSASYSPPSTAGWVTYNFPGSGVFWNGNDNIVVDVLHMNCTTCPTTSCSNFTYNGVVYQTNTSFTSVNYAYADGNCSIWTYSPTSVSTTTQRPNIRLAYQMPSDINWLNVTGLYKNNSLTTAAAMTLTDTNKSVFASPPTTTVYRVVANIQGCLSNPSAPDTVFVNPAPNVIITPAGTQNLCTGGSVQMCVNTGFNQVYQWYRNGVSLGGGATSNCYVATIAGVYTVKVTNQITGCADSSLPDSVIFNPKPVITITAGGPTTFCNGGNVVLTANATSPGLVTWQWMLNGSPITGATSPTYTATLNGTYRVYGLTTRGCVDTSGSFSVIVNTTPSTVTANGPTTFCTGGSVTLSAPTPPAGTVYTYQWYNASGVLTGQTNQNLVVSTTGSYYVTVTNTTTGCTSTSAITSVTVGAPPPSTITPNGAVGVCAGGSVTLTTNTSPGLTYQWYRNAVAISGANSSTYTVSGIVANSGSYTVNVSITGTPACNSTSAVAAVVTINPLPTPTATASGPTTFCQGNNVSICTNTGSGLTYQWNLNGTAIAGATSGCYSATAAGGYSVTQTNTVTGCTATSSPDVVVTVNPLPAITINPASSTTFCAGGNVVLNANPSTGLTYQWKVNNVNAASPSTNSSYTASLTGLYTVTATNPTTGCANTSAPTSVLVNPKPDVTTTPNGIANACVGSTTTISVPTGPGLTYQWLNASNAVVASTNVYTTGTAGTYRAVVINSITGCRDTSATVQVIVNPLPTAVATAVGPTTICNGDSTKLKVSTDIGTTFQWYNIIGTANVMIPGATDSNYYAKLAGAHYAIVKSAVGCTKQSNSIQIIVNPRPPAYITYNTALDFCEGSAVVLNANPGANLTYQWLYNGSPIGNTGTYNISNLTGAYSLKTTNQFGCSSTSDTLGVLVHPTPVPSVTQSGLMLQTGSYLSYQWFYNNVAIGGATNSSYTFSQNGAYKVRVVDQYGCEGTSNQFFINNVGVSGSPTAASIKVFPNPTTGILHIQSPVKVKLVLRDVTGKSVLEASDVKDINLGDIANGMYLLYISDLDGGLLRAEKVTKTSN